MRDLERDARARSEGLEAQGKLPAGFTAEHYPLTTSEQRELRRYKAALELADSADTFIALVHGRPLPKRWYQHRLRQLVRRR